MKMLCLNTVGVGTQLAIVNKEVQDYKSAEFSKHSETLFQLIEKLMVKNELEVKDLDAVGVVIGPGSFTGIRIGLSVAKVFGYIKDMPIIAVNALEVLAYNVVMDAIITRGVVCATINAGGNKVYYQVFDADYGVLIPKTQPGIMKLEHLKGYIQKYYPNAIIIYNQSNEKPLEIADNVLEAEFRAESLAMCCSNNYKLCKTLKHNEVMPIYIRDSQAELIMVRNKEDIEWVNKEQINADEIMELEQQGDSEYTAWNYQTMSEMLSNTDYHVLMARYKGKNLGFVVYKKIIDEWEIERVMVYKGARLQGIAKCMLSEMIRRASEQKIVRVILEVNEKNYPAYRLYSDMGFVEDCVRRDYYGEGKNAILMSKNI